MKSQLIAAELFNSKTYNANELGELVTNQLAAHQRDTFFSLAARDYMKAVGTYLNRGDDRPKSTLANAVAMALSTDFNAVLGLLLSDTYARPYVYVLKKALDQGATGQVGMVMIQLQNTFGHLAPGPDANAQIQRLIEKEVHQPIGRVE